MAMVTQDYRDGEILRSRDHDAHVSITRVRSRLFGQVFDDSRIKKSLVVYAGNVGRAT